MSHNKKNGTAVSAAVVAKNSSSPSSKYIHATVHESEDQGLLRQSDNEANL